MDVDLDYDGDPTPEQIMDIDAEEVRRRKNPLGSMPPRERGTLLKTLKHALADRLILTTRAEGTAAAVRAPPPPNQCDT